MKPNAAFDSSFWVHHIFLNLSDVLLEDFSLFCTAAVERELGENSLSSLKLKRLLSQGMIKRREPQKEKMMLYGKGERAAINLALENRMVLLIDDWRPYEAAAELGIKVIHSMVYLVHLYKEDKFEESEVLEKIARIARRGTIKSIWIESALKLIGEIRKSKE